MTFSQVDLPEPAWTMRFHRKRSLEHKIVICTLAVAALGNDVSLRKGEQPYARVCSGNNRFDMFSYVARFSMQVGFGFHGHL